MFQTLSYDYDKKPKVNLCCFGFCTINIIIICSFCLAGNSLIGCGQKYKIKAGKCIFRKLLKSQSENKWISEAFKSPKCQSVSQQGTCAQSAGRNIPMENGHFCLCGRVCKCVERERGKTHNSGHLSSSQVQWSVSKYLLIGEPMPQTENIYITCLWRPHFYGQH